MRRRTVARPAGLTMLVTLLLSALAGCAVEFGEDASSGSLRDRNRLYLQEQERIERQRQTFENTRPSER